VNPTALAIIAAVAAVSGLIWWAMHVTPLDEDFIDYRADRAFRARTGGKATEA
jgi:hypothetical protein